MRHISNVSTRRWSWGLVFAVCVLAGCGSSTKPVRAVSGTVKLDGKPLTDGSINFISAAGFSASSKIKDGSFSISNSQFGGGIPLGDYQVAVEGAPPPDPLTKPTQAASTPMEIPRKYRDPATSGLTAKVDKNSKPFEFGLESK